MLNVLYGVNSILKNLLKTVYVGSDKNNTITVQTASPADGEADKNVSIFCYKIMENPFSKSHKPVLKNLDKIKFPPLILDLYYLVTINLDYKKEEDTADILGKILRLFYDNSILSGSQLDEIRIDKNGNFIDEYKNAELTISLNQLSLDDLNRIWTMFPGTKYRTSLSYMISPVIIPSEREISSTFVRTKTIKYGA